MSRAPHADASKRHAKAQRRYAFRLKSKGIPRTDDLGRILREAARRWIDENPKLNPDIADAGKRMWTGLVRGVIDKLAARGFDEAECKRRLRSSLFPHGSSAGSSRPSLSAAEDLAPQEPFHAAEMTALRGSDKMRRRAHAQRRYAARLKERGAPRADDFDRALLAAAREHLAKLPRADERKVWLRLLELAADAAAKRGFDRVESDRRMRQSLGVAGWDD